MALTKAHNRMIAGAPINVLDYGATGNGTSDDTTAIQSAINAAMTISNSVYFPSGDYLISTELTCSTNLFGDGPLLSTIIKGANIDMIAAGEGCKFRDLSLDGQGSTYTGRGIVMSGTTGRQNATRVNITDMNGFCIDFTTTTCGSQSNWANMIIYRTLGTSIGYEAVHIEDASQTAAYPRSFNNIQTNGNKFIQAGGCNYLSINDSYIGNIEYSNNSRTVLVSNCRYGVNESTSTMRGFNNVISGCNVAPVITLASGVSECTISSNTYNQINPIVDSSGQGGKNILDGPSITYTPTLSSTGTAPTVGNGTITGQYSRHGSSVTVTVYWLLGSTSTGGTGDLQFSLPIIPIQGATLASYGTGIVEDSSAGDRTICVAQVATGVAYAILLRSGTAGPVLGNNPYALATNDIVRFTVTYTV
jgi:hypothetical protein